MITVYSKEACSKCNQAKMLLSMKGVDFEVKMLGVDYDREYVVDLAPKQREFPVITVNGKLIGGLEDLKTYLK